MTRCNAFYGEPNYDTTFYRCQLLKGHEGEHYKESYPLRVYWHDIPEHEYTDREGYLLRKRATSIMRRVVDVEFTNDEYLKLKASSSVLAEQFIQNNIKRENQLSDEYYNKYKTWRRWLVGIESEGRFNGTNVEL